MSLDPVAVLAGVAPEPRAGSKAETAYARTLRLEMPQLAVGGLSESWLLTELGRIHWAQIFRGLGLRPAELEDSRGDRVYPTFAKIAWTASAPLCAFSEDSSVEFRQIAFQRADGYALSEIQARSGVGRIEMQAFSIDVKKIGGRASKLRRVASAVVPKPFHDQPLVRSWRDLRLAAATGTRLAPCTEPTELRDYVHEINPFYEVNGVNLLYFAAHPIIANLAERHWAQSLVASCDDLAFTHSPVSCEATFLRNCETDDRVICRIDESSLQRASWRPTDPIESKIYLYRESDRKLMSIIHTCKIPAQRAFATADR